MELPWKEYVCNDCGNSSGILDVDRDIPKYLYAIHVYAHRINCYKNNQNTGHSSPVSYAWFEYLKRSHNSNIYFPPAIYWIEK